MGRYWGVQRIVLGSWWYIQVTDTLTTWIAAMSDVFTNVDVGEIFCPGKGAHKGRKLLNHENILLDQGTYPRLFIDS